MYYTPGKWLVNPYAAVWYRDILSGVCASSLTAGACDAMLRPQ
jgi:hypothetical protein